MNILTQSKEALTAQFGAPMITPNLIGGNFQEKAYEFRFGGTLNLRVGFYNNVGRYACFVKGTLAKSLKFTPAEVQSCLTAIAPAAQWRNETARAEARAAGRREEDIRQMPLTIGSASETTTYACTVTTPTGDILEVNAWHSDNKPYVLAYLPNMSGQVAVVPSAGSIDPKFPTVTQVV